DRVGRDVRLGVARAVPVEVVAAGAPAAAVVLGDRDLEVGGVVGQLDRAVGAPDRQLPADVRLRLQRVAALAQGETVQGAPFAAGEVGPVGEDAGRLPRQHRRTGLAFAVCVELDPVVDLDFTPRVLLPVGGGELGDEPGDAGF